MSAGANVIVADPTPTAPGSPPPAPPGPTRAWEAAAGRPEVAAPLDRLPAGLAFTDATGEPIHFDAAARQLRYRGFMCQASYIYLRNLSPEPPYQAAIDCLYLGTACGATPPRRGVVRWAILLVLALALALGLGFAYLR